MGSQEAVRGMQTAPRNRDPSMRSQPDVDGGRWAQDPGRGQLRDSAPSLPNVRYSNARGELCSRESPSSWGVTGRPGY